MPSYLLCNYCGEFVEHESILDLEAEYLGDDVTALLDKNDFVWLQGADPIKSIRLSKPAINALLLFLKKMERDGRDLDLKFDLWSPERIAYERD